MVQERYQRKKGPKKRRKKIGDNMVSTKCKTAVRTHVVVFMFPTTQISKLIYTASFNKCLAFKPREKVFFKVICVFNVAFLFSLQKPLRISSLSEQNPEIPTLITPVHI
jgi:hypothetical protein